VNTVAETVKVRLALGAETFVGGVHAMIVNLALAVVQARHTFATLHVIANRIWNVNVVYVSRPFVTQTQPEGVTAVSITISFSQKKMIKKKAFAFFLLNITVCALR